MLLHLGLAMAELSESGEIQTQSSPLGWDERPQALQKACPTVGESP